MRTTIIIDEGLEGKLKGFASKRMLPEFINQCLKEHFAKEERRQRLNALAEAYSRASKGGKISKEYELTDVEDWPEC